MVDEWDSGLSEYLDAALAAFGFADGIEQNFLHRHSSLWPEYAGSYAQVLDF